jgi:hypothetical protein
MSEIPTGARTSEYYRTNNIPERFDNPGKYTLTLKIRKLKISYENHLKIRIE